MKFCEFLLILNCYIWQGKAQLEFMYLAFQSVMIPPYSEEDILRDNGDEYYPFSLFKDKSYAGKVYAGDRVLSKADARFVWGHFDGTHLKNDIDDFDEGVKQNLCNDLKKYNIMCDTDNVGEIVVNLFHQFIEAAIFEKDSIVIGVDSKTAISVSDTTFENQDTILLLEMDNKCPLCKKRLMIKNSKNNSVKRYTVVQIFPEDINKEQYVAFGKIAKRPHNYSDSENLIVLCSECAASYLHEPTIDEYKTIHAIKESAIRNNEINNINDNLMLDKEINDIVNALLILPKSEMDANLRMDALKIEQKILPYNTLLLSAVSDDVTNYYRIIEDLFSDIDSRNTGKFDIIANEFRMAYVKLKALCLSQDAIVDALIKWLRDNTGVDNYIALHIVVSFFIQNCEVFDEISQ